MVASSHSAPGPALGYVHQVGSALVELASEGPEDHELRLEVLDDVSWHDALGHPLQALQVKHHLGSGQLTDLSVDLWRTLKVWMDDASLHDPTGPALRLATTQSLQSTSALSKLTEHERDVPAALALIDAAARRRPGNRDTRTARDAWIALPLAIRTGILNRLVVLPDQGSITDIEAALRSRLFFALPVGHESTFLSLLLGWWWNVAVDMLSDRRSGISRADLKLRISDLREEFAARTLPVTVGRGEEPEAASYADLTFVQQLNLLDLSALQLRLAVRDYYRAYAQMHHWLNDTLLDLAELDDYEQRVIEEWSHQFEAHVGTLGPPPHSEVDLRDTGRRLYNRATEGLASIRPAFNDAFYSRGTQHRLADDLKIGWHPDFEARLKALLGTAT